MVPERHSAARLPMLTTAFAILALAILLGSILAVLHLRESASSAPPLALGALHGLLALGGFLCLLAALGGPTRGMETGTASFGKIAATFLALALLAGMGIFALHLRRRRLSGTLIGIHASLAVCGFVILAAYIFAG